MSFFDKKNAIDAASKKHKGGKAAAGMAAAAVAVGGAALATEAGAQSTTNVASYVVNDDNSLTVTYLDGSTATFAAGSYTISGGQVALADGGVLVAGGLAGLAALAFAAMNSNDAHAAASHGHAAVRGQKFSDGGEGGEGEGEGEGGEGEGGEGAGSTFMEEGYTNDHGDPVLTPVLAAGTEFTITDADMPDGAREVEFATNAVSRVTLDGDDGIDLIDVDVVELGAQGGPDGDDFTITGLDAGDRVEIANEGEIEGNVLLYTESGSEMDNPLIVSLESVTITGEDGVLRAGAEAGRGQLEALRLEATGPDASSVDRLGLFDSGVEYLQIAGDQHLTIKDISGTGRLAKIDASQADAGVTIGDYNAENAEFDDFVDLPSLTDYDGSSAADLLGLSGTGDDANIDLAGGDDILDLDDDDLTGDVVISAGSGADVVDLTDAELATDATLTVDLGHHDEDVDSLILGEDLGDGVGILRDDVAYGDGFVTVQNFEVGTDTLTLNGLSNSRSPDGENVAVLDAPVLGEDPIVLENDINIIAGALTVDDLTNADDVLDELGSLYEYDGPNDEVYVLVNDGADSALFFFNSDNNGSVALDESYVTLVAVFEDTADMTGMADVSGTSFVDFA